MSGTCPAAVIGEGSPSQSLDGIEKKEKRLDMLALVCKIKLDILVIIF
jgi:hypothetical protein